MADIQAIFLDLYGTLVEIGDLEVKTEILRNLKHRKLLTTDFESVDSFVDNAIDSGQVRDSDFKNEYTKTISAQINSVKPHTGALPLLKFLKRKGHMLGIVSNLASPYKMPVFSTGMDKNFDTLIFSCDEGIAKPDKEIYLRACKRLGVSPQNVLFLGDSYKNDFLVPSELGMSAIYIGSSNKYPSLDGVTDLGLMILEPGDSQFNLLISPDQKITFNRTEYKIEKLTPVPDDVQGKYNLIYVADARTPTGSEKLFIKRYLTPSSVHVEKLVHELNRMVGLPSCQAELFESEEPLLITNEVQGKKYEGEMDPRIAYELGKQFAFAYLISNADIDVRNTFINYSGHDPRIQLIDFEHCLFNFAINNSEIGDPFDPHAFDALPREYLERKIKKKVFTEKTIGRAIRRFLDPDKAHPEVHESLKKGFIDFYGKLKSNGDSIYSFIEERTYREPSIITGTKNYRRAFSGIDLNVLKERLGQNPKELAYKFL